MIPTKVVQLRQEMCHLYLRKVRSQYRNLSQPYRKRCNRFSRRSIITIIINNSSINRDPHRRRLWWQ